MKALHYIACDAGQIGVYTIHLRYYFIARYLFATAALIKIRGNSDTRKKSSPNSPPRENRTGCTPVKGNRKGVPRDKLSPIFGNERRKESRKVEANEEKITLTCYMVPESAAPRERALRKCRPIDRQRDTTIDYATAVERPRSR
ncbi:hypothetical protein JTE90_024491 [Oedothorax gibbosus]|uniref:Uncharacterized protein n=1 Tax=Oedothorax gibbosus TaxID=931172 RepID=A0AAV6U6N6_9ARAC|nr:hypothetical protein JTE90_024491 [Oedothorax gibbosus]